MIVSQEPEVLWEPQDPHEAMADTLASLRVDGLELDEFGLALMQRIADGEIDHDEAIAEILARYRK
jgi:hypothetical protein